VNWPSTRTIGERSVADRQYVRMLRRSSTGKEARVAGWD
jgi:hypothetical protein